MCFHVKKCCYCIKLKTGCYVIGGIMMAFGLLLAFFACLEVVYEAQSMERDDGRYAMAVIELLTSSATIIFTIIGLVGIIQRDPRLMRAWICIECFSCVLLIVVFVFYVYFLVIPHSERVYDYIHATLPPVYVGIAVYSIQVLNSYALDLDDETKNLS